MPDYRRALIPGGIYFFTLVTHQRRPILVEPLARRALRTSFTRIRETHPFQIEALCLLPDHLHCVWSLPEHDYDYSTRWKMIKALFSHLYLDEGGKAGDISMSKFKKGEVGIWQRRFWEHYIRDQVDLNRYVDYIHYNPVKHGLVRAVRKWPWSSFHRYVRLGLYTPDWGERMRMDDVDIVVGE